MIGGPVKSLYSMTTSEINALSEKEYNLACNAIEENEDFLALDFQNIAYRKEIRKKIKAGESVERAILAVIFGDGFLEIVFGKNGK